MINSRGSKRAPSEDDAPRLSKKICALRPISDLLADVEQEIRRREDEREKLLTEWEHKGLVASAKWFPPIADPALWHNMLQNTIDPIGKPGDHHEPRDGWKIDELHGDKIAASIACRLFKEYELSHPWQRLLSAGLLSNAYHRKICAAHRLSEGLSGVKGKHPSADVVEVYFSNLESDAMYSFTPFGWDYYLSSLFEQSWRPILLYLQELYGSPVRLDGVFEAPITAETRREEIILQAPNFSYAEPELYDYKNCRVYKVFVGFLVKFSTEIAGGYQTTITVHIPKDHAHSFWQSNGEKGEEVFTWDVSADSISFQVSRWGPTEKYSRYFATQRAKDFIRSIRWGLVSGLPFPSRVSLPSPKFPPVSCSVMDRCVVLNEMWRDARVLFFSVDFPHFAINSIQRVIDSSEEAPICQLLKYYQSYFHMRMGNFEGATGLLVNLLVQNESSPMNMPFTRMVHKRFLQALQAFEHGRWQITVDCPWAGEFFKLRLEESGHRGMEGGQVADFRNETIGARL